MKEQDEYEEYTAKEPNHWRTASIALGIVMFLLIIQSMLPADNQYSIGQISHLVKIMGQQVASGLPPTLGNEIYKIGNLTITKKDFYDLANAMAKEGATKFKLCDIKNDNCVFVGVR